MTNFEDELEIPPKLRESINEFVNGFMKLCDEHQVTPMGEMKFLIPALEINIVLDIETTKLSETATGVSMKVYLESAGD